MTGFFSFPDRQGVCFADGVEKLSEIVCLIQGDIHTDNGTLPMGESVIIRVPVLKGVRMEA